MTEINFASREITCKIVYYGPGRSGKTTNLEYVHSNAPSESVGEMVSVATETDRTIFFDFLSLDLGQIAGMNTKFQLYTVPGQVYYNATRKIVLQGADGVIFVADSSPAKRQENIDSLDNLWENMKANGLDPEKTPVVFQWNKRDLAECMSVDKLEKDLNTKGAPSYATVATEGKGVLKTLKGLAALVIEKVNEDLKFGEAGRTQAPVPEPAPAPAPAPEEAEAEAEEPVPEPSDPGDATVPIDIKIPMPEEPVAEATDIIPAKETSTTRMMGKPAFDEIVEEAPTSEMAAPDLEPVTGEPEPGPSLEPSSEGPPTAETKFIEPGAELPPKSDRRPAVRKEASGPVAAPPSSTCFKWRWLAGMVGALILAGLQWAFFWDELASGWAEMTSSADHWWWLWLRYAGMGAMSLAAVALCGLIAGVQDRSVFRCAELGLCWMAIVTVGLAAHRVYRPWEAVDEPAGGPAAVRMAELSLSPGLLARGAMLRRAREDAARAETALKDLSSKRLDSEKVISDARDAAQAQVDAARKEVGKLAASLKALEAEKAEALNKAEDARKAAVAAAAAAERKKTAAEQKKTAAAEARSANLARQVAAKEGEIERLRKALVKAREAATKPPPPPGGPGGGPAPWNP